MVETHEKEGKQCMEKQSTIIEDILSKDNLNRAYQQVIKNKGAAGVDGMECEGLLSHLRANGTQLRESAVSYTHLDVYKRQGSKERFEVNISDKVRADAVKLIREISSYLENPHPIKPELRKRCNGCSLNDLCNPRKILVQDYMECIRKKYIV